MISFYKKSSGHFIALKYTGPINKVMGVCPDECSPIEGDFNPVTQKFDIARGVVVDFVPEAPSADFEVSNGRWRKKMKVTDDRKAQVNLTKEIQRLELAQLRPERELRLDPNNETALRKIAEIDAKIAELRQSIRHG